MKTIGLLGGMSWESTHHYYAGLNQGIQERLGGLHSAPIWLRSVDFAPIESLMRQHKWEDIAAILITHAKALEEAGAEGIVLCTNTMHKLAPVIQQNITIPLLHIAQVTAQAIRSQGLKEVILLGTRFTMEEDFYTRILQENHLIVHTPNNADKERIDRIIFEELCLGKVTKTSKKEYVDIIEALTQTHPSIQGVILGCTEIGMLISQDDLSLKVFDTTTLHVKAILDFMTA